MNEESSEVFLNVYLLISFHRTLLVAPTNGVVEYLSKDSVVVAATLECVQIFESWRI